MRWDECSDTIGRSWIYQVLFLKQSERFHILSGRTYIGVWIRWVWVFGQGESQMEVQKLIKKLWNRMICWRKGSVLIVHLKMYCRYHRDCIILHENCIYLWFSIALIAVLLDYFHRQFDWRWKNPKVSYVSLYISIYQPSRLLILCQKALLSIAILGHSIAVCSIVRSSESIISTEAWMVQENIVMLTHVAGVCG